MNTTSSLEGIGRSWAQQAIRKVFVHGCMACACLLMDLTMAHCQEPELPFTVAWIEWSDSARARQREAYRAEAHIHEVLFCVEKWRVERARNGHQWIVIERTRRAVSGERYRIPDVGSKCRDAQGRALPTIHTHSEGSCQLSPPDLVTIARRGAPFDGVQCGDKYFVWAFAWQIKAVTTWIDLSTPAPDGRRVATTAGTPTAP